MNLETLKNEFFIGESEKIDELCASLKPDCIQTTDKVVTVDEITDKLLYNSEDDNYISQHMDIYKECPFCHELEKVDDFVTVKTHWINNENKITLCRRCLESETVVVPEYKSDLYLPLNSSDTIPLIYPADKDHLDDLRIGFCSDQERSCYRFDSNAATYDFWDVASYDYENDQLISNEHDKSSCVLWHRSLIEYVSVPGVHEDKCIRLPKFEIESHPETWVRCSQCGNYYHHSMLEKGKCCKCREVKIYDRHKWDGQLEFLKSNTDFRDEKMFFGTVIETHGHRENNVYVDPYRHIWHLEHEFSHDYDNFKMISQPMTLAYAKEHASEFEAMFQTLRDHDQGSYAGNFCVHVSRDAFVDDDAIYYAVALVNRFQNQMEKFGRDEVCHYSRLTDTFTRDDIAQIVKNDDHFPFSDNPVIYKKRYSGNHTVKFRFFRGTLDIVTYLATLEFVANIVKAANAGKPFVRFSELLEGEYIEKYISGLARYGVNFDREETISFINLTLGRRFDELCRGTLSVDDFLAAVNAAVATKDDVAK